MSERPSFGLPASWRWVEVREVAEVITGNTPPTSDAANYGGTIPFVKPPQLVDAQIWSAPETLTANGAGCARLLPPDAVLVSCIGNLGKTAITKVACATNQQINALVFAPVMNPEFGWYYAQTLEPWLASVASATTVSIVNKGKFATAPFPLAPVKEQARIVETLEELLSDLDAGVAELKAAQRKLAQYRQSLLKAAVEGALTADWRTARACSGEPQETGADLLQRILTERRARWQAKQLAKYAEQGKAPPKGWQAKYPEPVAPDTTDLPALPDGWAWASVDQCALDDASITDGPFGSNLKSAHYTENGPRVLRLQNIGDGHFVDAKVHISQDHYGALAKHSVAANDVIVAMLGEILPRACIVPEGIGPAIVKADCARIRLNTELLLPAFLNAILNAEPTHKRVARVVKGIGRPRVNLGNLRSIPIPLPPITEQMAVCDALKLAIDLADEQEESLRQGFRLVAAQRKNILKAAFAGQLVPQDPNDEPASALLERIRAQRAATGQTGNRQRGRIAREHG